MNFKTAFASARKAGKKTFSWNGKSYTTELAKGGAIAKSPRPEPRPSGKPSVMSDAPKMAGPGKTPAPIVGVKAGTKPIPKPAPVAPSKPAAKTPPAPRGGISDWERANKGKPVPSTKGPSVSQVAKAIDYQGSGYSDVMKGGPRTPPPKKPYVAPRKSGWGDK